MRRLSITDYLADRSDLFADWHTKVPVLSRLSFADQRTLHDYFAFMKQLNEKEARVHRTFVTAADPSLPHRAGKARKRFRLAESIDWRAPRRVAVRIGARRRLTVRAVMRPKPDLDAIAQTVLSIAIEQARREQDDAA